MDEQEQADALAPHRDVYATLARWGREKGDVQVCNRLTGGGRDDLLERPDGRLEGRLAQAAAAAVICDGTDPPQCCGAPHCPACGSARTMPTLLAPREWACWEPACFAIWKEES